MENYLYLLKDKLEENDLVRIAKILNDSYQPFMFDNEVWELIFSAFPAESIDILKPLQHKMVGHRIVNDLVLKYYPGEKVVKYHFVKEHLKINDEITIFEMNINSSRLDIGRINGSSYAYEIKTELDNLGKLQKQIEDYSKAFEYVTVVVHEKHFEKAKQIIPSWCGIQRFKILDGVCKFDIGKKAKRSPKLDMETQIRSLTSRDLEFVIKLASLKAPKLRVEREELIFRKIKPRKFNEYFKMAVKNRFCQRWEYLCETFDRIYPIDVQMFFATQANPTWIYYKNSSIV